MTLNVVTVTIQRGGSMLYSNSIVKHGAKQKCQCNKNAVGRFFANWRSLWLYACIKHLRQARRDGLKTQGLEQ